MNESCPEPGNDLLLRQLERLGSSARGALFCSWDPHLSPTLYCDPLAWLSADTAEEAHAALEQLDRLRARPGTHLAGLFGYELGAILEPAVQVPLPERAPLVRMGAYAAPLRLDEGVERFRPAPFQLTESGFDLDRTSYRRAIEAIHAAIGAGDVYQVNFTFRWRFSFQGDPRALFLALGGAQPARYSALLRDGECWSLSLSPELFFQLSGDRIVLSPMKGTLARGRTLEEDRRQVEALRNDPKSRAENLMIVDLIRNDLGRIARTGSVEVTRLFEVHKLPTLFQMTSDVEARVPSTIAVSTLLRALFPNGSVTGAPKIAAMQLIHRLERSPRGAYCGAIGRFSPEETVFNVAIRTLTLRRTAGSPDHPEGCYQGELGIGSGIVIDSDADAEWDECRLKAHFLTRRTPTFELLETLRFERGYQRLRGHWKRLRASAAYFDFPLDDSRLRSRLREAAKKLDRRFAYRIRIRLAADGGIVVESSQLAPLHLPVAIALHPEPVDSSDPFLFHKTTFRDRYREAQASAVAAGLWDWIFRNQRGEVTEGSICNLFIRRGVEWWTPPVECGLLPGVMRAEAIRRLGVQVRPFGLDEILAADEIRVSNSLRGLIPARFVLGPLDRS